MACVRVVLQAGEELRVAWAVGEVEVEEVEFADAGVGEDFPDLVALWMATLCEYQSKLCSVFSCAVGSDQGTERREWE